MNDKADDAHASSLEKLRAKQNNLTAEIKSLFGESRFLHEEIRKVETSKGKVAANATKINSEMRELEHLQKDIQAELTKLTSAATALTPTESASLGGGVPAAPPPPPPLAFHVAPKNFIINSSPKPRPNTSARVVTGDVLSQISAGVQLKKSAENTSSQTDAERAQERVNELRRLESSIKVKEAEVGRLLNQIRELSSKLKTEEASQVEYQQALGSQVEALSELGAKKEALAGKLTEVKEKVGAELSKIEARKVQELAEKEKLATEQNTTILEKSANNIPDAPPPPPPPPMDNFKAPSKPAVITTPVVTPRAGKEERLSMDEMLVKAEESRQKREAAVVKNYVINLLIDMVIDNPGKEDVPGNSDVDDEFSDDDREVENTESVQQRLFNLIGADGLSELKEAIQKSMVPANTGFALTSLLAQAMALRRGAIASTSVNPEQLQKDRDKAPIKDAVAKFIDAQPTSDLLAIGKEIKQREDAEAGRKAEAQKIDEERKAEALARAAAEAKQKEAAAVQKKLSEMLKNAVVNTTDVKQAKSAKDSAITDANAKKSDAQRLDSFLSSIDEELAKGIRAVQTADELRIAALAKAKITGAQAVHVDGEQAEVLAQEGAVLPGAEVDPTQLPEPPLPPGSPVVDAAEDDLDIDPTQLPEPPLPPGSPVADEAAADDLDIDPTQLPEPPLPPRSQVVAAPEIETNPASTQGVAAPAGHERMYYDAREFFLNIKTSIKNKTDADNELIAKKANTVESTDDELLDGMEAEQVGAQEVVYKGDFLKSDQVIVAEAELAPGKILHLEQDKSGKVVDRSSPDLSVEAKQIAALKQAQMLLNNYDPRKGDIVIRGRDKEQAERIYAAVLHFVKNDPEIKKRMESSRWILPSTFSPEKLIRCNVPGFVPPKTIDSGFIAKHLPIIKELNKEQLDVLTVSKKAALEQPIVNASAPIDVVKTQKDFKAQFRELRQSRQNEQPELGEMQAPANTTPQRR